MNKTKSTKTSIINIQLAIHNNMAFIIQLKNGMIITINNHLTTIQLNTIKSKIVISSINQVKKESL